MKLQYLIYVIALLLIATGAQAQTDWHMTHTSNDGQTTFTFTALSCLGDNCTASGTQYELNKHPDIVFWRSSNGGKTWKKQNPGLQFPFSQHQIHAIQQIDSLNVVAVGDTGYILRTFDGGETWTKQESPTPYNLSDVSFSDSLNGIASGGGKIYQLFLTSDGGRHWNNAPFPGLTLWQCHAYGAGKYRFFKFGFGTIYTTNDNWKTIDSTKPVYDTINDPKYRHVLARCNFSGGDTILAYGVYYYNDTLPPKGLIVRSTDAGVHWSERLTSFDVPYVQYTTSLARDTVYADGEMIGSILKSTDRGESWKLDTLIVDTVGYGLYNTHGLAVTGDGTPIGIFSNSPFPSGEAIMARRNREQSKVEVYERILINTHLFPNPASNEVTINTLDRSREVYLSDILGREVLYGITSDQGILKFDISRLPCGVYNVILNHYGIMLPVGMVVVVGK